MGRTRGGSHRGSRIIPDNVYDVDPSLRYLLKRGDVQKRYLATTLHVPEVKTKLVELTRSGVIVDAKVLHDAIKPVYEICSADKARAVAEGYPLRSISKCYGELDAIVNPNNVTYAGPVVEVGKVGSKRRLGVEGVKIVERRTK